MRCTLPFLPLFLLLLAPAEAQKPALSVDYGGTLTYIVIRSDTLKLVWYTGIKDPHTGMPVMAQSLAAYDKHVFQTRLTPAQTAWLDAWVVRDRVFSLRRRYPTTQPGSYGTAFRFTLAVSREGKTHVSTWDDTSHAKPAWAAAQELKAWCERIPRGSAPVSPR